MFVFFMPLDQESLLFLQCIFFLLCPVYAHVNLHLINSTIMLYNVIILFCCLSLFWFLFHEGEMAYSSVLV